MKQHSDDNQQVAEQPGDKPEVSTDKSGTAGRFWAGLISVSLKALLACTSALLLAVIFSVLLFVYSQSSREWLVKEALPALLSTADIELLVSDLNTPSIGTWSLASLSLKIAGQERAYIEQLQLDVNDWSLFRQALDIQTISAAAISLDLTADSEKEEPEVEDETAFDFSALLEQPFGLRIHKLDINKIALRGLPTELPELRLQGRVLLSNRPEQLQRTEDWLNTELKVTLLNSAPSEFTLSARLDQTQSGQLDLGIEEPAGGWLGQLMQLPENQPIQGELAFTIQPDAATQTLFWQVEASRLPWYQRQLAMDGKGSWDANTQKLDIGQARLTVNESVQAFNGWWQASEFALNLTLDKLPLSLAEPFQDLIKGGQLSGELKAFGRLDNPEYAARLDLQTNFMQRKTALQIDAAGDFERLEVKTASLNLGKAKARLSGEVYPKQQTLNIDIHQLQGPVSIIAIFGAELPPGLSIELLQTQGTLSGDLLAPNYAGKAQARGRYKTQDFRLTSAFNGDIDKVSLSGAKLTAGDATLSADGLIDWQQGKLDLRYQANQLPAQLASLADLALPAELSLNVDSKGSLKGAFEELKIDATASLTGAYQATNLQGQLAVSGDINQLQLRELQVQAGESLLNASGSLAPSNQLLDIQLHNLALNSADIAPFLPLPETLLANVNAQGQLGGSFSQPTFDGKVQASGSYRQASFDIQTELDANLDELALQSFTTRLTMPEGSGTIKAQGQYRLADNRLNGKLNIDALPLSILELTDVVLPASLSGQINSDLSINGPLPFPRVSGKFETAGQFNGETFNLAFIGTQSDKSFILHDVQAKWMNTSIFAKGELSEEILDFDFRLKQFQISELSKLGLKLPSGAELPSGLLDIQLDLMGSVQEPVLRGEIQLALADRLLSKELAAQNEPIRFDVQINTQDQRLFLDTKVSQDSTAYADLQLSAQLSSLITWLLDPEDRRTVTELPLDLAAKGELQLAWLSDWLEQDAQYFAGQVNLDTQVEGSLQDPQLQGTLQLSEGKYQNAVSQTDLEQIEVELGFQGQAIKVLTATASDGQNGQLRLEGGIDLASEPDGEIDLSLLLNQVSLVRREDIEGEASGEIKLTGPLNKMTLSGEVNVAPFQIMLDRISSDSIPEIQVSSVESKQAENTDQTAPSTVQFNLLVLVDQQAFIRGRGLDAELNGKVQLSGTDRRPNYNGRFQVIRGNVDLFAKTFRLQQGNVLFSNDAVSLFAQARHKAKDLTFIATLEGSLDNLKISLRTEPPLPEDEAVARLLFGKSVRNITPVQAIQLANAIQTLSGEGSGFDPLGTAREILNVDRISIESQETSEGKGVAIGLGKYVTEKVYVEVSRTPEPTQPWEGSVEVELTPDINLETTTSGSSGFGGVELQWKNDY